MNRSRPSFAGSALLRAVRTAPLEGHTPAVSSEPLLRRLLDPDELFASVSSETRAIVARRHTRSRARRRGWLVRRLLVAADVIALVTAFSLTQLLLGPPGPAQPGDWLLLGAVLPLWILMAKIYGLYDRDEERADHSTVDDVPGVFHLVTVGVWLLFIGGRLTGTAEPTLTRLAGLWILAILLAVLARAIARAIARRNVLYLQNVVIVGAGDVGQLVARKILQHPEAGFNIVGFVDDQPRERRSELSGVALLGRVDGLPELVEMFAVDRVIVAFSRDSELETVDLVRRLRGFDVQIDVVPRLFEAVGLRIANHSIEALPLVGLPPVRLSWSSRVVKRLIDVVGASIVLLLTAPLFVLLAILIKRDSPGPIFFKQTRLGIGMREFTALKFRTMRVDTDDRVHRDYIRQTMTAGAPIGANGLYKLDRSSDVTRVGRWLRRTSLDELPQLLNVLRGDMSLVGPRPCLRYETELFKPHQFERFLVPAGLTGLWQVAARANSTFGESLDMDVAYARGWSLGLDLRLLCRTPLQMIGQRGTA
jgi:exopolysaccharide biosynthesis polyprenyl glycosylphosphotransferase